MLTFDASKHQYFYEGKLIPSATQLLKPLSDEIYKHIDKTVLDNAARRGTEVHKMVEMHLKYDTVELTDYSEDTWQYYNAFTRWTTLKPHLVERVIDVEVMTHGICHGQRFGGTIDIVGEDFLIDIKTRECKKKLDILQLVLYNMTFEKPKEKLFIVSLLKTGQFIQTELSSLLANIETGIKINRVLQKLVEYYRLGCEIKELYR